MNAVAHDGIIFHFTAFVNVYNREKLFLCRVLTNGAEGCKMHPVKAKASLSMKLMDAFAFFISFFEKERLLWVRFLIILAVWCLMTGS